MNFESNSFKLLIIYILLKYMKYFPETIMHSVKVKT